MALVASRLIPASATKGQSAPLNIFQNGYSLNFKKLKRKGISMVLKEKPEEKTYGKGESVNNSPEEVTKKWGLEAGLWNVFSSKNSDGTEKKSKAGELLARYGSAYLITSISLSLVSFGICYELVSIGVDINGLLQQVGIQSENSEAIGTFALAYAAHKAASPIRFPPTVALTPLVADIIGKKENKESDSDKAE